MAKTKETLQEYSFSCATSTTFVHACFSNIDAVVKAIDPIKDSEIFVNENKTGLQPPSPAEFEHPHQFPVLRSPSLRGFGSIRKRASLLVKRTAREPTNDDFSDLPPEQQKRRLISVVEKLEAEIDQLEKNREGLDLLAVVYQQVSFKFSHSLIRPLSHSIPFSSFGSA